MLKALVSNTYDPYKDEKSIAYIDSLRKKDIVLMCGRGE